MKLTRIENLDLRRFDDRVLHDLTEAQKLISDRSRWWGKASGHRDEPSFCAVQAISRVAGRGSVAEHALRRASWELFDSNPEIVNDEVGHEAVMEVYNRAIAQRRQEVAEKLEKAPTYAREDDLVVAGD